MLHKSITYTDIDGVEVTEDFWFHIGRDEVVKKALTSGEEDYLKTLQDLQKSTDGNEIMAHFESLLGDAVGKREGKLMKKTKEIKEHFLYSGAYGQFFMDLLQAPDSGAGWLASMMPNDAQEAVREEMRKKGMKVPGETVVELPNSGVIEGTAEVKEPNEELPGMPEQRKEAMTEVLGQERVDKITSAAEVGTDEDPAWLKELRRPTAAEMRKMSKDDLQLVFKMREAGVIS